MTDSNGNRTKLAVIQNDITYIKEKLNSVDEKVSNHYVTKEEFDPVKKLVYSVVGIILIAVVGALTSLVVKK